MLRGVGWCRVSRSASGPGLFCGEIGPTHQDILAPRQDAMFHFGNCSSVSPRAWTYNLHKLSECRRKRRFFVGAQPQSPRSHGRKTTPMVMMRIIAVSIFGALLAACSGSSRVADIFRANAPPHPPTQYTARTSGSDIRGTPEIGTRTTVEAVPQESPKSVVRSLSEE